MMKEIINYLIEVNLALILFLITYRLLLANETNFRLQRFFVLSAILIALAFPLLSLDNARYIQLPSVNDALPSQWLLPEAAKSEILPQASPHSTITAYDVWLIVGAIYTTVVLFLVLRLTNLLFGFFRSIRRASAYKSGRLRVIESTEDVPTFSLFYLVCIGRAHQLTASEKEMIIRHESVHAAQWHSVDILLVTLLTIVFWFNPLINAYKKILTRLHEFEADACIIEVSDTKSYCRLLAKVALQDQLPIGSHFSHSLILKRIEMMRTIKRKMHPAKMFVLASVIPVSFFIVACHDQIMVVDEPGQLPGITINNLPSRIRQKLHYLKESYPDCNFTLVELEGDADLKAESDKKIAEILPRIKGTGHGAFASTHKIPVSKELFKKTGIRYRKFMIYGSHPRKGEINGIHTYLAVTRNAHPQQGMIQFQSNARKNTNYPEAARSRGIRGKVQLEFIVEKDGRLSNIHVTDGIGYGCDEEAIRILSSSGPWVPGQQDGKDIRQRMVVSIPFSFNNSIAGN